LRCCQSRWQQARVAARTALLTQAERPPRSRPRARVRARPSPRRPRPATHRACSTPTTQGPARDSPAYRGFVASRLISGWWDSSGYWPESWKRRHLREARIFIGGVAPAGYNVKILWAFLAPSAKDRGGSELVVEGDRLDGRGAFRQEFAAIGYAGQRGAPSYASIIDVPRPGCWRLTLTTGDLSASIDFRAVRGKS
jgi:hypothetical protein